MCLIVSEYPSSLRRRLPTVCVVLSPYLSLATEASAQTACPTPQTAAGNPEVFGYEDDGGLAVRSSLTIHSDGASVSYAVGNGGSSYLENGVDLHVNVKN